MEGVRIDLQGNSHLFIYTLEEYEEDRLDVHAINTGFGEYEWIEDIVCNNNNYMVFGWKDGDIFNVFDLESESVYGDILIVRVNVELDPMHAIIDDIINYYIGEDLDDTDLQDRFEDLFDDEEYDSSFVCEEIIYCSDYDPEHDAVLL